MGWRFGNTDYNILPPQIKICGILETVMRIAIDISQVIYETGVSYYTRNLVKHLLSVDKQNEYLLFGGSLRRLGDLKRSVKGLTGKYSTRFNLVSPGLADILWNRFHLIPVERLIGKIEVVHSSDWAQPRSKAFKVTTVHDLYPVLYPDKNAPKVVGVHQRRLKWVKKEVDRVVVPSEATQKDLVKLGFDKSKIRVVPEALDPIFKGVVSDERIKDIKAKYGLTKRYLLGNGINHRKNTLRIIEAFRQLDGNYQLVLIGEPKIKVPKVEGVVITGHIDSGDRPALFSGAEVLVYPSLHEGFGLPILEAFACRVPVVTSNLSSMPVVAGGAAILVDPLNIKSIEKGIKEAIKDKKPLVTKGLGRVRDFSWEKTALETLKVYEEVNKR